MSCRWKVDRALVAEPFASDVTELLTNDPADWVITTGARDPNVERAGHEAWLADHTKPKFTDPSNSAHCRAPALAVDVTLVKDGKDDWDYKDADWQRMVAAVVAAPRLHSLGPSIGDWDHIEAVGWRTLRLQTAA
jgi:hypothetical protein